MLRYLELGGRRLLVLLAMRLASWEEVCGIKVGALPYREVSEEAQIEKIIHAVMLIDRVCPRTVRHMRRNIRGVLGLPTGRRMGDGAFVPLYRLCLVDPRYVGRADVDARDLAQLLVHEATHARLYRSGIRMTARNMERVEAVCSRAERRFAALLHGHHGGLRE